MAGGMATLSNAVRTCLRGAADLLLPGACAACDRDDPAAGGLCEACNTRLLALAALDYCPRCGTTLGPGIPAYEGGCSACPATLPRFARVVRLGPYAEPLRQLLRDLKYHRREATLRRLSRMLATAVTARCDNGLDLVLPVPMHWRRRLARGCDHARALARGVARELALPVGDELSRVRNTPPQVGLSRTRRAQNVRGAFRAAGRTLAGARVLLVDDVTTTGATASEAAAALRRAGAAHVTLAVVAKSEAWRAYAAQTKEAPPNPRSDDAGRTV